MFFKKSVQKDLHLFLHTDKENKVTFKRDPSFELNNKFFCKF